MSFGKIYINKLTERFFCVIIEKKQIGAKIMDKKLKQNFLLVAFGVALFAVLTNLGAVIAFFSNAVNLISPVVLGFLIAFILNVPMRGFEKLFCKLSQKRKKPLKISIIRSLSLLMTLLSVLLLFVLVCTLVIPALVSSIVSLYDIAVKNWPEWQKILSGYHINTEKINQWLNSLDIGNLIKQVTSGAGSIISSAVDIISSTVSSITSFAIAVILSVYVLMCKGDLSRQLKRLIYAHMKSSAGDYIIHVASLLNNTFSKFLSGQCVEACILGTLIFVVNAVLGVPYAALIGVLTAVMAFVPYVGALAACGIGAFLVALSDPTKVIACVAVYIVIQFIETQLIYPHVVGTSVGLSPLWTLVAVLIGGNLMGLFGMIFFIPLTAVMLELLKEHTKNAEKKKAELQSKA